jgi:predicted RNA polymerase sigma factor
MAGVCISESQVRRLAHEVGRELIQQPEPELDLDDPIGDDLLRLIFIACHPALKPEGRAALTLKLLGGLSTGEIARAFLISEPTAAQRIVRAKRTLADKKIPYELPAAADLPARLTSVLGVLYLIFNEGYSAAAGEDWIRPALCEEALRLGRILSGLAPEEPEVHGLVALMELQASRFPARTGPDGEPVLLLDQDRRRWDHLLIRRGLAALERSVAAGLPGPYTLQAAIAACHAHALDPADTDWQRIAGFYALLVGQTPTPVVRLNHAVAVGMANGPAEGLRLLDELADTLPGYPQLPAARAELLARLGRHAEARAEFTRAADLTANTRERTLFQRRAADLP